jgi:hypothetical protein
MFLLPAVCVPAGPTSRNASTFVRRVVLVLPSELLTVPRARLPPYLLTSLPLLVPRGMDGLPGDLLPTSKVHLRHAHVLKNNLLNTCFILIEHIVVLINGKAKYILSIKI